MIADILALTPFTSGRKVKVMVDGIETWHTFRSVLSVLNPDDRTLDHVLDVQDRAYHTKMLAS